MRHLLEVYWLYAQCFFSAGGFWRPPVWKFIDGVPNVSFQLEAFVATPPLRLEVSWWNAQRFFSAGGFSCPPPVWKFTGRVPPPEASKLKLRCTKHPNNLTS